METSDREQRPDRRGSTPEWRWRLRQLGAETCSTEPVQEAPGSSVRDGKKPHRAKGSNRMEPINVALNEPGEGIDLEEFQGQC